MNLPECMTGPNDPCSAFQELYDYAKAREVSMQLELKEANAAIRDLCPWTEEGSFHRETCEKLQRHKTAIDRALKESKCT